MVISDPRHTECSKLTKPRWKQYTYNYENSAQVHELLQSHCGDNQGTWFS